jgi:predicted nucleic acid-binding protein
MSLPATPRRILDADILIDIQRQHPPAVAWYKTLQEYPTAPGLVIMELIQDARNKMEVERALRLVKPLPVVWPTQVDCDRALQDFRILHLSHSLGLIDALIAATTIGLGTTLCTFSVKHYRNIAGLTLEQPYNR